MFRPADVVALGVRRPTHREVFRTHKGLFAFRAAASTQSAHKTGVTAMARSLLPYETEASHDPWTIRPVPGGFLRELPWRAALCRSNRVASRRAPDAAGSERSPARRIGADCGRTRSPGRRHGSRSGRVLS